MRTPEGKIDARIGALAAVKVTYSESLKKEVIAWLQQCKDTVVRGGVIQPDPFWHRNNLITPVVVAEVIGKIQRTYEHELKTYPGYHNNANSISVGEVLTAPGFEKLPYLAQRAVVIGIDKIYQAHKAEELPAEPVKPIDYWNEGD